MNRRQVLLTLMTCGIATLWTACGSGQKSDLTIEVKAENTRFVPDTIEVPAGKTVSLRLTNMDPNEHDLEVRGVTPASVEGGGHDGHGAPLSVKPVAIAVHTAAKKSASVTFQIDQKGTYEVVCTIPGHEQMGMMAKLIVI